MDDVINAVTTITAIDADLAVTAGAVSIPGFSGQLGQTVVTGSASYGASGIALNLASKSIANADLPALFRLAGMQPYPGLSISGAAPFSMTTAIGSDLQSFTVTGKAAIAQVQLGAIALQSLQAPFRFDKKIFTMDPMTFTLYKGRETGRVSIDMSAAKPVYAIRTSIAGLDVDQALSATTTMKHTLLGIARVQADVKGAGATSADIQQSLAGTVGFAVNHGIITNFPLLSAINQAVGITGGNTKETAFDSLTGTAVIANGKARTNDLTLRAGGLTMTGKGTYGLDQSLDMQTTTTLAATAAPAIRQMLHAQGEVAIPVHVTGTASAPKFAVDVQTLAKKGLQDQLKQGLNKLLPH